MSNKIQKKQIQNLIGIYYKVASYSIPFVGAGFSNAALTTAINGILSSLIDSLGVSLINTENGGDTSSGLACGMERVGIIVEHNSLDPLRDEPHNQDVVAMVSRRTYIAGLSQITGITIDYVSQGCSANNTSCILSFDAGLLSFSTNGGTGYGTSVNISTLVENDCIKIYNTGSTAFLIIRKTAAALPITVVTDTLTISNSNYSVGLFSYINGVYQPYYNTQLIAIDFAIPVVIDWNSETPSSNFDEMGGKFLDVTEGSAAGKQIVESINILGQNSLANLSFIPAYPGKTILVVNGGDNLFYTDDFTLTSKAITLIPANVGYNIEITDAVKAIYFKV